MSKCIVSVSLLNSLGTGKLFMEPQSSFILSVTEKKVNQREPLYGELNFSLNSQQTG